ncbi:transmembrane protein 165 isoform X2 [Macrosteles quadrilineatus]|uniref:transmembrane protein 165 isoform X2 n=1 Tax=Macrosteles quadrilineatus TaxID=74068 RepID=UPI0023E1A7E7|nr:transmembrane protein 165 isoform X2 [Macrosteles quadrilineatus]
MGAYYKCVVICIYVFYNIISFISAEKEPVEDEIIKTDSITPSPMSAVELPTLEQPSEITLPGFIHAFVASLSVIIVSEIGDKTFFIAAIMAMKHSRLTVFLGAISALVLMTILSVLFGWLATVIPRNIVYYISTALFAIFGVKMLWEGYHMPPGGAQEEMEEVHADLRKRDDEIEKEVHMMNTDPESGRRRRQNILKVVSRIFLQAFTLTFLAEWGDRSQLTTIVLAAREDIYGVMLGGVVGHSLCTGIAVVGGRFVAQRISVRTVTIIGGVVFLIFALSALIFNPLSDDKVSS